MAEYIGGRCVFDRAVPGKTSFTVFQSCGDAAIRLEQRWRLRWIAAGITTLPVTVGIIVAAPSIASPDRSRRSQSRAPPSALLSVLNMD